MYICIYVFMYMYIYIYKYPNHEVKHPFYGNLEGLRNKSTKSCGSHRSHRWDCPQLGDFKHLVDHQIALFNCSTCHSFIYSGIPKCF